jgi:hypothetical protein
MRLGQHLRVRKYDEGGPTECPTGQTLVNGVCKDTTDLGGSGGSGGEGDCPVGQTMQNGVCTTPTTPTDPAALSGLTNIQSQTGSQFEQLAGLSQQGGQALSDYLESEYGLQDAGEYLKSFEEYNPYKEQELKQSYQMGMGQAQTGARQQMGDIYAKARAGGSKGGGFGGRGKSLAAMKGKTLSGLEGQQQKMTSGYQTGVQGLREDYVGDWLGQVGKLGQMGAKFCTGGKTWVDDGEGGGECK